MRVWRWVLGLFGLLLLINGAALGLARREPPQPAYILFHADYEAQASFQLYRMRANGGDVWPLSPFIVANYQAMEISPDGRHIVGGLFDSQQLYRFSLFGQRATPLTNDSGHYYDPSWSPDGTRLAYSGELEDGFVRLFVYDLMADQAAEILIAPHGTFLWNPQWLPDGEWLFYGRSSRGEEEDQLYRIRADGSEQASLGFAYSGGLSWSPDGDSFVFIVRSKWEYNLYRADLAQDKVSCLTCGQGSSSMPHWSPDGEWIAFISDRQAYQSLYKMRPDGSDVQRLTDLFAATLQGSPDGEWLLFNAGVHDTQSHIYKISVAGGDPLRLTDGNAFHMNPAWMPIVDLPYRLWVLVLAGTLALLTVIWWSYRQT